MEKDYVYALIAIVLIVLIVGVVSVAVNYQPRIDLSTAATGAVLLGNAIQTSPAADNTLSCYDSDAGESWYQQGTVKKGASYQADYCSSSRTLVEYFCRGDTVTSKNYDCASLTEGKICLNGACIKPECKAGQVKNCFDANGCNGINACNNGFWGPCTSVQLKC